MNLGDVALEGHSERGEAFVWAGNQHRVEGQDEQVGWAGQEGVGGCQGLLLRLQCQLGGLTVCSVCLLCPGVPPQPMTNGSAQTQVSPHLPQGGWKGWGEQEGSGAVPG